MRLFHKAALRWAAHGIPVFPCVPGEKRPYTSTGFKAASTSREQIEAWWLQHPGAWIGVPTGQVSGIVVVDIDTKEGRHGLTWWEDNQCRMPGTRLHRTVSSGMHALFKAPKGVRIRSSAGKLHEGVDMRGDGGYVIVPPSEGYKLIAKRPLAAMPAWLVEQTKANARPPSPSIRDIDLAEPAYGDGAPGTAYGVKALQNECKALVEAPNGQKHVTLVKAAYSIGGLVPEHLDRGHALFGLRSALIGLHAVNPCQDFRAAERTLYKSFEDGMHHPRAVPEWEVRQVEEEVRRQPQKPRRPMTVGALRGIARKVATAAESERERLLFWAARRGAEAVRLGVCARHDLIALLELAAASAGLGRGAARLVVDAALRRAQA